jgi:hypothetical protein
MARVWTSPASRFAVAAAIAGGMALFAAATPAQADWRGPYYGHRGGWRPAWGYWGGGPRWGVIVAPRPYPRPYYPPPPVYYAPPPVYYAPPPVYYAAPPPVVYAPGVALGLTVR